MHCQPFYLFLIFAGTGKISRSDSLRFQYSEHETSRGPSAQYELKLISKRTASSQLTSRVSFCVSGSAHYKRSAGAGAIQLGGVADLQPERLSVLEPERESQFGRPSHTVSKCKCKIERECSGRGAVVRDYGESECRGCSRVPRHCICTTRVRRRRFSRTGESERVTRTLIARERVGREFFAPLTLSEERSILNAYIAF